LCVKENFLHKKPIVAVGGRRSMFSLDLRRANGFRRALALFQRPAAGRTPRSQAANRENAPSVGAFTPQEADN
jgi:hypothetical protein